MEMFEKASKMKLRFDTSRGLCTTEDLWDMPLTGEFSLDSTAKGINKLIKENEEESFVTENTTANKNLTLRIDILKHIIAHRLNSIKRKEKAIKNDERKEAIMGIIAEKEHDDLKSMSVSKLKKLASKL